jgi:hypothetical protein
MKMSAQHVLKVSRFEIFLDEFYSVQLFCYLRHGAIHNYAITFMILLIGIAIFLCQHYFSCLLTLLHGFLTKLQIICLRILG